MESSSDTEGRVARSWRLTRAAWELARVDRALLVLAVLSGALGIIGLAAILGLSEVLHPAHTGPALRRALAAIVLAYPLTFANVFLNTAVAAAAAAVLDDGRRLSLREALAVPTRRVGQVALWALLAAGVGVALEQIASRLPFAASIASRLLGLVWSLASLFAIPILAVDGCAAPECLRRSARLVKERWGEGISGNVIVTAWLVLFVVPAAVLFGLGAAVSRHAPGARDTFIALGALVLLTSIAISAVVRQTFAVALFRYAETGVAQGPFQLDDLQAPFSPRRGLLFPRGQGSGTGHASATPPAEGPTWRIALGILLLLLLFVLSFGLPLLELILLVVPAVGFYMRSKGRASRLASAMTMVGLGFGVLRLFLPGLALRTVSIDSAAMQPTIAAHERVLFDRTGISSVHVGAIVSFHAPRDAHRRLCGPSPHMVKPLGAACAMSEPDYKKGYYIRRVVAGPGDVVSIAGGRVILNGRRQPEPFATACNQPQCNFPNPIRIPSGMWFVMADNRRESDDSRFFGPVPRGWIAGVALMSTWPPDRVGGL